MTVLGHTITWGTHIGVGRATGAQHWYAQLKTWWVARKAARHDIKRAALEAHWDPRCEAVRILHAGAASDMVAPTHAHSVAMAFRDLGV